MAFMSEKEQQEVAIANALERGAKNSALQASLVTYYPTLEVMNVATIFTYALSDVLNDFNFKMDPKSNTKKETKISPYVTQIDSYVRFGDELEVFCCINSDFLNECFKISVILKNKNKQDSFMCSQKDLDDLGIQGLFDEMVAKLLDILFRIDLIEEIDPNENLFDSY